MHALKSQNQKLEQDKEKAAAKIPTLKAQSMFPNINQLTEHLVSSMKPDFFKLLSSHDFSSSIHTELKELPTKITALSGEVNELKKHIKEFEVELPEVAELKKHKWELHKEFLDLPGQISLVQSHIQTLEAVLITEDAELANLVDLMGIDVVKEYHKKKLLYIGGDGGTLGGGDVGECNFGNGSSSGCHDGLWWLIENEEDDEMVRVNTLKLKKLMNFFKSRKDLTELLEGESDEFILNHKGDTNDARVISLKSDMTIKVQNKTRDN
ncbi:hypothetical protein Tco_0290773 [Tanacetum coccineum]